MIMSLCGTGSTVLTGGSCESLSSSSSDATIFCLGVVSYSYYLPSGSSAGTDLDTSPSQCAAEGCLLHLINSPTPNAPNTPPASLNAKAIGLAESTSLNLLPTWAQAAYKATVCASVYKRCLTGVTIGSYATYVNITTSTSHHDHKLLVPYLPPCSSLCTNLTSFTAARLLTSPHLNCTSNETVAGYSVPLFQNTTRGCHALTLPPSAVAGSSEEYMGNTCHGVVSGLIYLPPAQLVNSSYAPLPPPGVIQSLLDVQASAALQALPVWSLKPCRASAKAAICSQVSLADPMLLPHSPRQATKSCAPTKTPSSRAQPPSRDPCSDPSFQPVDLHFLSDLLPYPPFLQYFRPVQAVSSSLLGGYKPDVQQNPPWSVCSQYKTQCASLASNFPSLYTAVNCSATDPWGSGKLFPSSSSQVVLTYATTAGTLALSSSTQPATVVAESGVTGAFCPIGYHTAEAVDLAQGPSRSQVRYESGLWRRCRSWGPGDPTRMYRSRI